MAKRKQGDNKLKYPKLPKSTKKCQTPQKYLKEPKSTSKYLEVRQSSIHPKSWGSWGSNPAIFFGFSAKFLAENPKPFMFSLCFETALPIFSKSCLNIAYILDKYTQISYFVSKYAILSQIHYIFMNNALLSQNLVIGIYALFRQFFGLTNSPRHFFRFLDVWYGADESVDLKLA